MDAQEVNALATLTIARKGYGVCDPEEILRTRALFRGILLQEQLEKESGELSSTQVPVLEIARSTVTSTTFATLVEWTVRSGRTGVLTAIEVEADFDPQANVNDYTQARWRITIGTFVRGGTDGFQIFQSLSMDFADLVLRANTLVRVEIRSADGSSITVDADITGKELS